MVDAIIIILLVLLVFLISCDYKLLKSLGIVSDAKSSENETVFTEEVPMPDTEGYSVKDELKLLRKDGFMNSSEEVRTWEPSTAQFDELGADTVYQTYAEDLKANVDRAIVESHREYVKDVDFLATTGASHAAARDDFMPAVQFHGLPRKAHYANVGAESTARVAQSETPEAVMDIREHNSTGYVL
jgi:hypothetical protein